MLRLMLFRHAKADRPVDLVDHERPLSIKGHKQATKMGEYIAAQNLSPDLAVVSSAKRTQESWMAASEAGSMSAEKVIETEIYEASLDALLDILRQQDSTHRSIMFVGHNPGMERLTTWLTGSGNDTALARLQKGFVVGSLAVIDLPINSWADIQTQTGRLERFETPDSV